MIKPEQVGEIIRSIVIALAVLLGIVSIIGSSNAKMSVKRTDLVKQDYHIIFTPLLDQYSQATSFILAIENKMNKDIELVWDRTLYMKEGATSGGFMYEGVLYKNRNKPKPPDIIFSNTTFKKQIWPNKLVKFKSAGGWQHLLLPIGKNGIYITMIIDGKEVHEQLETDITKKKEKRKK